MAGNDTFYGTLASVVLDSSPSLGQITNWDGLGGFTYVPNYHAYGNDSFTYHDVDQYGQSSNEATANIGVIETAPVASDVTYDVLHDNVLMVPPSGVLSNSTDADPPDLGYLAATLISSPTQGTLSDYTDGGGTDHPLLVDGSFGFTPPPKWAGTVTFQFNVSDGILSSLPATATIEVTDQAPVAGEPGPYYVAACDADATPNTLSVDAPGVLDGAYDPDGDKMTPQLVSGPSDGQLTLNQDGSFKYTPNAGYSGTDSFVVVVSDGIKKCAPVTVKVYVIRGDLQAATINNNAASGTLDRSIEETVGAFVPLDNVDQNYDGTADMSEDGPIAGEKDLLPITLKAVVPANVAGTYSLTIPANISVYQNADKTGPIGSGTTISTANDTTLYVEGVGVGSGMLILNWTKGIYTLQTDKVKITVFDWQGPENVPGTGIYTYTASGGGAGGTWLSPIGGTEYCNNGLGTQQQIQWSAGPEVGQAVYQASPNYIWGRDVNVVAITIGANRIYYENWLVQSEKGGNFIEPKYIAGMDGMNASAFVDVIGPSVDGQMRGVKFMQVGAIQNVAVTAHHAGFSGFAPPRERVSSMEGGLFLDIPSGSFTPWMNPVSLIQGLPDEPAYGLQVTAGDSPEQMFSDVPVLSGGNVDVPIDSNTLVLDFMLYIAAATIDSDNGSQYSFVQLASAHWQFDGSGTVTGAGAGTFGTWTSADEDNSINGDNAFTLISTGATVPVTTGPGANDAAENEQWSTNPPF